MANQNIQARLLKLIKTRRSIRRFKKQNISAATINKILEAGRFAPSGLNNQPWRFLILAGNDKDRLAKYTKYSHILKSADKAILIFLDKTSSYNYQKDLMAIGACAQNMLLAAHSLKLGACWLGEILNKRQKVNAEFNIPKQMELEVVIGLGKPLGYSGKSSRKKINNLQVFK